ncbi:MAG: maltose alpha-D-glucosyltransferase [Acidobacteriaceae bacterium]|nr:maltose alpha-D-glucosyltransferase [Acidobacteriaceae bacterium]MBV9503170.1 maltose alpha-D-glucosyltransferase [Acidobacteriaceae bacterium]
MDHSHRDVGFDGDPLWYKDAIIYEAHVRAFYDSNADGMGDFRGLAEKLDYLEDLGVTAIWLLPFFPSPWKDDGYDISDFRSVHPAYGTLRDFQNFLREAHRRGLRVITELVINHTSDQHEWFQKSRRAEPNSKWRNFYVWSDTPDKYQGVRIIFKDFEPSNWSWDPIAKSYYWHRFFSHQPDLNFDSPLVRRAIMHALDFWAGMGVDGFRLDAIPYLFEREGTSCENLPETHTFLRELRRHLDARFPHRMLLSEANMWPEDAVAYFGNGNECHMNFHFPLMPRLFMALHLEDRLPIVEILKRTPCIPETCQWAMFLRNHDELTLEMVTDDERDYMYRVYATDQRARINLGIRRRLAPLLGNDRSRIELMNALLFSLPGTPVIYYGDEIGMGDNVYLGDRNGVRTPMQWSPDRNAGFSSANPQMLYLPVNIDPAYHYEAINVESQQDISNSLLNWTKRIIALRKQYKAFGRGTLEFLQPANQHVLAYIRRYEDQTILVVANLSRFAQAVQLDLQRFKANAPVELFGRADFPVINDDYYPVTLGPNSFFWFSLEQREVAATIPTRSIEVGKLRVPVVAVPVLADVWEPETRASIAAILPRFLQSRPWFRSKDRRFRSIELTEAASVLGGRYRLVFVHAEYTTGDPDDLLVPMGLVTGDEMQSIRDTYPNALIADLRDSSGAEGLLYAAIHRNEFCRALLDIFARRRRYSGEQGTILANPTRQFKNPGNTKRDDFAPELQVSEVASTVKFGDRFILKLLRSIEAGPHPGSELSEALTNQSPPFRNAPPFAGSLEYVPETGESTTIGVLHVFVPNQGTAWQQTRDRLVEFVQRGRALDEPKPDLQSSAPTNIYALGFAMSDPPPLATSLIGPYLALAETMGKRVAEMHIALGRIDDPAFASEPFNDFYRQSLFHACIGLTSRRLEFIRQRYADMQPEVMLLAAKVLDQENAIVAKFRAIYEQRPSSVRQRFHGRLHLGHLLITGDDVVIFDFEGDPDQHLSSRRIKRCPLRDVASMLVSFGYAAQTTVRRILFEEGNDSVLRAELRALGRFWYSHVSAAFIRGYWRAAERAPYLPPQQADQQILLDTYLLERALLDVRADIQDKPELSGMPFRVILHLLDAGAERRLGA